MEELWKAMNATQFLGVSVRVIFNDTAMHSTSSSWITDLIR